MLQVITLTKDPAISGAYIRGPFPGQQRVSRALLAGAS